MIKRARAAVAVLTGLSAGLNAMSAVSSAASLAHSIHAGSTLATTTIAQAAALSTFASSMSILTLGSMMRNNLPVSDQGYLKTNTIHPDEAILGYMNIQKKKGEVLTIKIPVNGHTYSFDWDVKKKKKEKKQKK